MNIILFDTPARNRLFPLTLTRALADIRMGIYTMKERWQMLTGKNAYVLTEEYLQPVYDPIPAEEFILIDASVQVSKALCSAVSELNPGEAIYDDEGFIAGRAQGDIPAYNTDFKGLFNSRINIASQRRLRLPCEIFQWNEETIRSDFKIVSKNRISGAHNETVFFTQRFANIY